MELKPVKKASAKLPRRFSLQLVHCNRCYAGWLLVNLETGQGNKIMRTEFARADLHSEFVRAVRQ